MSNYDAFHLMKWRENVYSNPGTWLVWNKPRWCTMVYFTVIWPGAAGWSSITGANSQWGAWGGWGGIVTWFCHAYLLPNKLYIYVGKWGVWSNANAWGNAEFSYISTLPWVTSADNLVLVSGNVVAQWGARGIASWWSSTPWAWSTAMTAANAALSAWLSWVATAWPVWFSGTYQAAGTAATLVTSIVMWWPGWGGNNTSTWQLGWGITAVNSLIPAMPAWAAPYTNNNWLLFTAAWGWTAGWTSTALPVFKSGIWCGWPGTWWSTTATIAWGDGWDGLVIITAI